MSYAAVIGTFDGFHRGHAALLHQLRELAHDRGMMSMAVTFSTHPMARLCPGNAPLQLEDDARRIELLSHNVDIVLSLQFTAEIQQMTAQQFMHFLAREGVKVLLMGYDTRFGSDMPNDVTVYRQAALSCGIDIETSDKAAMDGDIVIASSAIRQAITNGDIAMANRLTGRHYRLCGTVVHGHQRGRTIGFPTANVNIAANRLIPAPGVYAASATVGNNVLPAMVNIGTCPTFNANNTRQTIEAHIIGFDSNIYNTTITLDFIARIRDEKQFETPGQLTAQLIADRRATLNYYHSTRR